MEWVLFPRIYSRLTGWIKVLTILNNIIASRGLFGEIVELSNAGSYVADGSSHTSLTSPLPVS